MAEHTVNTCPIFVSSSDAYADIWPAFFALFKREWPEYNGTIYLNTENLSFSAEGLNICCTHVGTGKGFGATFKAGIAQIPCDHFLLFMIDYFLEKKVDVEQLQKLYSAFLRNRLDSLTLMNLTPRKSKPAEDLECCREILLPEGGNFSTFSFQIAFWQKSAIAKLIADWETPWMAEYYGCIRAKYVCPRIWTLNDKTPLPVPYDGLGVLHGRGRWLESAIAKIDLTGIPLDYQASKTFRGVYVEPHFPRLARIPYELKHLHLRIRSRLSTLLHRIPR